MLVELDKLKKKKNYMNYCIIYEVHRILPYFLFFLVSIRFYFSYSISFVGTNCKGTQYGKEKNNNWKLKSSLPNFVRISVVVHIRQLDGVVIFWSFKIFMWFDDKNVWCIAIYRWNCVWGFEEKFRTNF